MVGASVSDTADPDETALTTATPEDPAVGDGFYTVFSANPGPHTLRVTASGYTELTRTTPVRPDRVRRMDLALRPDA